MKTRPGEDKIGVFPQRVGQRGDTGNPGTLHLVPQMKLTTPQRPIRVSWNAFLATLEEPHIHQPPYHSEYMFHNIQNPIAKPFEHDYFLTIGKR